MLKKLFFIATLCLATEGVRADYLWTWHGSWGAFQGSFEVPDAEMQPDVDFGSTSPLFFDSLSITSTVENVVYNYSTASVAEAGGYFTDSGPNDYVLIMDFVDGAGQTGMTFYSATDTMTEHLYSQGSSFTENGIWTYTYVPEPSATVLLALGAAGWFAIRKRSVSAQESK